MNFFKKLFSGKSQHANPESAMPTRALNLQYAPVPANGSMLARQFVTAVRDNENITLDYSVPTLDFVDQFLQRFSDEGLTVNDFAETIFVAGCYVGEVMIRNAGGNWIRQEDAGLHEGITMTPIVVKLSNGSTADPIAKAFKRFHSGEVDSVMYLYTVLLNKVT